MAGRGAAEAGAPRVSVVIPSYNAGRFLGDSVGSVLGQTWTDLECIVVDDGSTDDTTERLTSFDDPRLRVVRKENRGTVSDARNAGIEAARGELIALLDADDAWLPQKLERQLPLFDDPGVVLVYCGYAITGPDLRRQTVVSVEPTPAALERWLLLEGNGIAPSSTSVVRREAARQAGPFVLDLSVSEDVDWATRVASLGRVEAVPECLALYRAHAGQRHTDLDRFEHDMRWILADRFGRYGNVDWERWRRGTANLATRLAVYHLLERRPRVAGARFWEALTLDARRVAALPVEALVRRARRARTAAP